MTGSWRVEASYAEVTVCLVENDEQVRKQLRELLTGAGFDVVAAVGTRIEGEEAITDHRPDVAVIDNCLPDGSGIELCRTLTRATLHVELLLRTETLDSNVVGEALQAGAAGVILRSIQSEVLFELIRSVHRNNQTGNF